MVWLAFIGFIALTIISCFFIPRCCTLVGAIYLFVKLGLYAALRMQGSFAEYIFVVIFGILMLIMGYLDFKNLQLNPFKK